LPQGDDAPRPIILDDLINNVKKRSSKLPAADRPDAAAADVAAFAREMRDVVRLEPDPRGRVRTAAPISPLGHSPQQAEHADVPDNDFVAHGVDRREIRKLKRGDYIVRDRRDLHGMTGADALTAVGRLIENSRHRGYRCVCIIHGRGLHSTGNPPILKTRVREYLRSHRSVLAYTDAPASDGGAGAVYVLLRQ
jgi:DNA-nicking Smr family endonuclease